MSYALCVNVRTVRSWLSGRLPIPPGIREELRRKIQDKRRELLDAIDMLD
jgi:hypothetical protein